MEPEPIEILLVEDNPADSDLVGESLAGCKVPNILHVVEDGERAMRYLRREGDFADGSLPDLVLLDLNLPRKDGREVLAEMKNDRQLRRIPVVVMTSSAADTDVLASYDLHANAYILKPLDLRGLKKVVRAIESFWFTVVKLPS